MNFNQDKWYYSTWVIVVAFIVFWPAGIALLIMKNTKNKNAMFIGTTDKRKYVGAGIGLLVLGFCVLTDKPGWGILLMVGGGALLYYSKTLVDKANRNRKYIDLIVNQREGSLDNIAGVCNIAYDKAVKELKYLQTVGVLNNVQIDEINRVVNLIQPQVTEMPSKSISIMPPFGQAPVEEVMCTCPGCGAKVALAKGSSVTCEYCDSPITAN